MKIEISLVSSPVPQSGEYTLISRKFFGVEENTTAETIVKTASLFLKDELSSYEESLVSNEFMLAIQAEKVNSVSDLESVVYFLQENGLDLLINLVTDDDLTKPSNAGELEINILNMSQISYEFVPMKIKRIVPVEQIKPSEVFELAMSGFSMFDDSVVSESPFKSILSALKAQETTMGVQPTSKLLQYVMSILPRVNKALYYCSVSA